MMTRVLRYLAVGLLLLGLPLSEAAAQSRTAPLTTLQSTTSTGDGVELDVEYFNSIGLQVTLASTGTVNFQGSADGTTYAALVCTSISNTSGALVTSATATGTYQCNVAGLVKIRTPVAANGSTITVTGRPSLAIVDKNGDALGSLLSCEDELFNLCMVSGGAVRGTEGNIINSAVGDATSAAFTLPTGYKTLTGRITGAGTVAQVITVYGGTSSSMAAATSDVVCTITLSGTSGAAGTAYSCPPFNAPFLFYKAVTSGSSGTPTTILTGSY